MQSGAAPWKRAVTSHHLVTQDFYSQYFLKEMKTYVHTKAYV